MGKTTANHMLSSLMPIAWAVAPIGLTPKLSHVLLGPLRAFTASIVVTVGTLASGGGKVTPGGTTGAGMTGIGTLLGFEKVV